MTDPAQLKYVQEIESQGETWIQALWAHQAFDLKGLQTEAGEPITIQFPGWLNKHTGPDFTDARLTIGASEKLGAVEIHLRSSG